MSHNSETESSPDWKGVDGEMMDAWLEANISAWLDREVPRIDGDGLDEERHHCEWVLHRERERIHSALDLRRKYAITGQPSGRTVACQGPVAPRHESAPTRAHDGSAFGVSEQPSPLREALRKIAAWELPPTGKTWPGGGVMSYEDAFGSSGAKEYIRSLASTALEIEDHRESLARVGAS